MVVAEFTDANDTHPKVVAGTEPSGEQTTATGQSSTSTYAEKAASDLKDKAESSTSATGSDIKDKVDSATSDLQSTTQSTLADVQKNAESTLSDAQKNVESSTSDNVGEGLPDVKFVQRVGNIPLVAGGIEKFESVVNSTQITSSMYATAGAIAAKGLDVASPLITTAAPLINKADDYANQGLDMVESRFPSAFKATPNDVLESAKQPANQGMAVAKNVYDGQIAPLLQNEIVARAIEQLSNINKVLTDGLHHLKEQVVATTHVASEQAHDLTSKLADQLHTLQVHGKELPPIIRNSMSTAYTDVRQIMGDQEKSTQQKATDIAHYVQSIIQPELDKAQALLFQKKEQAKDAAGDAQAEVEKTAQDVGKTAQEATQ
ncbi:hypothetical protein NliqN6_0695 [Naganishia liquefaciens]|uniref:Uncharacterized protein n=1 Tax=Naganishia liquefaciens TaxID=104408 RepID=A0A8H3YCL2_9TREE|nr:hypothetical protein NliqN6_0695 [Naganishia liquefaciens]